MTKTENLTVEILKQIRDAGVETSRQVAETNRRLDGLEKNLGDRLERVEQAIGETNDRLGTVESTLLELAEQQRFLVRGFRATSARGRKVEAEVDDLRVRVERLEKRQA